MAAATIFEAHCNLMPNDRISALRDSRGNVFVSLSTSRHGGIELCPRDAKRLAEVLLEKA